MNYRKPARTDLDMTNTTTETTLTGAALRESRKGRAFDPTMEAYDELATYVKALREQLDEAEKYLASFDSTDVDEEVWEEAMIPTAVAHRMTESANRLGSVASRGAHSISISRDHQLRLLREQLAQSYWTRWPSSSSSSPGARGRSCGATPGGSHDRTRSARGLGGRLVAARDDRRTPAARRVGLPRTPERERPGPPPVDTVSTNRYIPVGGSSMELTDVRTGPDLLSFIEGNGWTPEQIASGLGYDVLSVKRWLDRDDDWFGGSERNSIVLRLAVRGVMAEKENLSAPKSAPPLKVELYFYNDDRVEVGKIRLARPRRSRGTGERATMEFTEV